MRVLSLFALAAPLVSAIQFLEPTANSTLTKGQTYDLKWSTVDTDPSTFSLYLVNFVNWPPLYTPIAFDLETAAGEHQVTVPCGVDSSYGFQFNANNGTNTYVIYAQTPKFYITGGPCVDATPAPTCEAPAATVTVTVSKTLSFANSTLAIKPTSSAVLPPKVTVAPTPGKCPDTIGWGSSGYGNPVTLTQVPTGPGDVPAAPTTTKAPGAFESGAGFFATTSTIYKTVTMDLSEFQGCKAACKA